MSRRVPPERVEIYRSGQSIKLPSKETWSYREAEEAFAKGEGVFRDKKRKLLLFAVSASRISRSSLGVSDSEALAGVRDMDSRQRERLEGWGFLGAS
jgi:hypothetical protein